MIQYAQEMSLLGLEAIRFASVIRHNLPSLHFEVGLNGGLFLFTLSRPFFHLGDIVSEDLALNRVHAL